jgi:hypothetical protein
LSDLRVAGVVLAAVAVAASPLVLHRPVEISGELQTHAALDVEQLKNGTRTWALYRIAVVSGGRADWVLQVPQEADVPALARAGRWTCTPSVLWEGLSRDDRAFFRAHVPQPGDLRVCELGAPRDEPLWFALILGSAALTLGLLVVSRAVAQKRGQATFSRPDP